MRAIQVREFGGPEALEIIDLPTGTPGPTDLLVTDLLVEVSAPASTFEISCTALGVRRHPALHSRDRGLRVAWLRLEARSRCFTAETGWRGRWAKLFGAHHHLGERVSSRARQYR